MSTPSPSLSDIPLVEQRCSPTPRITLRLLTYLFGTRFLTRESLRDDLILIAILFPMSLAPFPLAAASGKSRSSLVEVAMWASCLAFWCCLASSCTTHWMLSRIHDARVDNIQLSLAEEWSYRLVFGISRLVIVLCMAAGTIAMLGIAMIPNIEQTCLVNGS